MILFKNAKIKSTTKKIKVLQKGRLLNQPREEDIARESELYQRLIDIYQPLIGHKKFPHAQLMIRECYRAGASLDNAEFRYLMGKSLLDEAKYREQLEKDEVFSSPANQKAMKDLYQEAHAYLQTAQALGHIQAKRLQGLSYINGWGVDVDQEKGFDLIVASIDQEGTWDKVPEIFTSLGLNKPEFFAALGKHRSKK